MKLYDALNLMRQIPADAEPVVICIACGFTPLHFETLLAGEIWQQTHQKAEILRGLYGDLPGSLRNAPQSGADAVICLIEWSDLDPRLGLRSLGGWSPRLFPDILETAGRRMLELQNLIADAAAAVPVALSLPTLPLPPISFTSKNQAGVFELQLQSCVAAAGVRLAQCSNVRVLSRSEADLRSNPGERLDIQSELVAGFPYTLPHAAAMAGMFARLISNPLPKKGLITDLDDTFWKGIVGEVGTNGIGWTLEAGAQVHGLYQQLLAALAEAGVLLAVASKNDPGVVDAAFAREDLILAKQKLYPIEVNWEPKSHSIARILQAWNIHADSVVVVDDSAMELAEIAASYPGIQCFQFPTGDARSAWRLFEQLRECFSKSSLQDEDLLRAESIRQKPGRSSPTALATSEDFLDEAKPELSVTYADSAGDVRALELINKTNQFNLNGNRHSYASLRRYLEEPGRFMAVVSYKDKYGPLGKIAVICGARHQGGADVDTWVMSCRAFSRRIEYWCLQEIFERFDTNEVTFRFCQTERNRPFQDFLSNILGEPASPGSTLTRTDFLSRRFPPRPILMETSHA
ncbi:MAG: HAD-IIIC family phosphatase [Terriglobia bacterium]